MNYNYNVGDKVFIKSTPTTAILNLECKIGEIIEVEPDMVKVKIVSKEQKDKEYWLLLTEIELYRKKL